MTKYEEVKEMLISKQEDGNQRIDSKMLDIVTALTCLGYDIDLKETSQGGPDKVTDVDINYNEDTYLLEGRINKAWNFFPYITLKHEYDKPDILLSLMDFLTDFYTNRNIPMKHSLVMIGGTRESVILRPQSGNVAAIEEDKEERIKIYNMYTNEFSDFAEFLKTKIS